MKKKKKEELSKAIASTVNIEKVKEVSMGNKDEQAIKRANLALRDYVVSKFDGDLASIRRLTVNVHNF